MLEFLALGPFLVQRSGRPVPVARAALRRLLAVLLINQGTPVRRDTLIDQLWPGRPAADAQSGLHVHVSNLRRVLGGPDSVDGSNGAYTLRVGPERIDAWVFERRLDEAWTAFGAEPATAVAILREALGLWRGPAYEDLRDTPMIDTEAGRLDELRLDGYEAAFTWELDAGLHDRIAGEVGALAAANPYRERLRAQHMLALFRCGRKSEALAAYQHTHEVLDRDLGMAPMPELQELHRRMLDRDPRLAWKAEPQRIQPAGGRRESQNAVDTLPRVASSFTGRLEHLRALDEIAASGGESSPVAVLSAITGMAGVGKTALAVRWARHAAGRFPDGVLYLNLQGYGSGQSLTPLAAASLLLTALGVPAGQVPGDEQAAISMYRSRLADRRLLVLLDNARQVGQVRSLLTVGPGCMTVVTSRDRLTGLISSDGARRVPVDVMSAAEASTLLAAILGDRRVAEEPEAIGELSDMCGALPLALRIAAATLLDVPERSIAEQVRLMAGHGRLHLLAIDGDPDSSVSTALSFSYAQLRPEDQRMFRRLGVAPGQDIQTAAAAALIGADPATAGDQLDRLCAAHLVESPRPGRYRLHDLVRAFAGEVAATIDTPAEQDSALHALLVWYSAQAYNVRRTLSPNTRPADWIDPTIAVPDFADVGQALAWMDADGPNIMDAIRQIEHTHPAMCWQLATSLFHWLSRRRPAHENLSLYHVALAAAAHTEDAIGEAQICLHLGTALSYLKRFGEACVFYQRGLELDRRVGSTRDIVSSLSNLGGVLVEMKLIDEALTSLEEARQIAEDDPDLLDKLPTIYQNIGAARYGRSLSDALPYFRRAVQVADRVGDEHVAANGRKGIAATLMELEQYDEAQPLLETALVHAQTAGHVFYQARIYVDLGVIAARQGRLDDAREYLRLTLATNPTHDAQFLTKAIDKFGGSPTVD